MAIPEEVIYLSILTFIHLFAWLPGSRAKMQGKGPSWLKSNRSDQNFDCLPAWGSRSMRAHENLKDYYPSFAVTVILLIVLDKTHMGTLIGTQIFVGARIVHFVSYVAGNVVFRALAWSVAMVAQIYLMTQVFR